jgi:photosystem II stability/assembly factor-like uncharacterized protein
MGEIYRSIDNGMNWTKTSNGIANPIITTLAVNSNGAVFAGTYGGLFRSSDNGDNWNELPLISPNLRSIAVTPNGHIFAGITGDGVARSTDNGVSWTRVNSGLQNYYLNFVSTDTHGYVYACSQHGIERSLDEGATWTESNLYSWIYSFTAKSNGLLFAAGQTYVKNQNVPAIFKSTDNGLHWTQTSTFGTENLISSLTRGPNGDIYAGSQSGNVFRSSDDGVNWSQNRKWTG